MIEAIWSLHTPFASDRFSHPVVIYNMYKKRLIKYAYHLIFTTSSIYTYRTPQTEP